MSPSDERRADSPSEEAQELLTALAEAGVDVEHTNYEDAIHDFANMVGLDGAPSLGEFSEQVLDDAAAALDDAF